MKPRVRSATPRSTRLIQTGIRAGAMLTLAACARWAPGTPAGPDLRTEAASLTGRKLVRPRLDDTTEARLTAQLNAAADTLRRTPNNPDALIWVGRRLAYLGRYREAIDTFTAGVDRFPKDARFLRHRGHRYLTIRRPMLAARDLALAGTLIQGQADVIEPDGAPNAQHIPLYTLHFSIWYHLGLAHYVDGRFAEAVAAWDLALRAATNDDARVAVQYWRYIALTRLARHAAADSALAIVRGTPPLRENLTYAQLLRLFGGITPLSIVAPGSAINRIPTIAYGVSMWHLFNGRAREARELWQYLDKSPEWAMLAVLAAEGELTQAR
jgi:tetratricopeptide (TPR) repeat protein